MRPFNLEAALAGEPVMLGSGEEVHYVGENNGHLIVVHDWKGEKRPGAFTRGGVHTQAPTLYLVMKPKKRTLWINVYDALDTSTQAYPYRTMEEADRIHGMVSRERVGSRAWPLEIEE